SCTQCLSAVQCCKQLLHGRRVVSWKFKRILVPLDGSRLAESVLPVTVVMAQVLDARIMLLHIIEEHAPQTIHGEQHLTSPEQAEAYLTQIVERYADRVPMDHP